MELLTYSLTLIVCFIGLFFGVILAFSAKEELNPGKKYFFLMQKIIILIILIILLKFFNVNIYIRIISYILMLALMEIKVKNQIIYPLTGIAFFLGLKNNIFYIPVLIFLYGFPSGTLFACKYVKKDIFFVFKKLFFSYFWFLIVALALKLFVN